MLIEYLQVRSPLSVLGFQRYKIVLYPSTRKDLKLILRRASVTKR